MSFTNRLQRVLIDAGFDAFVEAACKPYYAAKMGAPSERLDSERGIAWRCADSYALRDFLRLARRAKPYTREVHEKVFSF